MLYHPWPQDHPRSASELVKGQSMFQEFKLDMDTSEINQRWENSIFCEPWIKYLDFGEN